MAGMLHWLGDPPALRDPVLLVSLEGFIDAGSVAASASMFLRHRWQAEAVGRFDRDLLIDYRARRPTIVVDDGELQRVDWPDIELFAAEVDGPRDAVLLLGPEPDMNWEAFCEAVAHACERLGVTTVVGLGAYPAAVPHTRPVRILQATNGVPGDSTPSFEKITGYNGPIGAATIVQHALGAHGVPGLGLWAEIPHYLASSPNPPGTLAMVRAVVDILGTQVDTTELEAAAKTYQEQVDETVASHEQAAGMVEALEKQADVEEESDELPSGEDIAAEIERFLSSEE